MDEQINQIIRDNQRFLIIQADNPDGDSLGSSLALEAILTDMGKTVYLYCGVDMPNYLRFMKGWDRVTIEIPTSFDASIIVDASTMTLLEKLSDSGKQSWVASKPCVVLDHHESVENQVPFATVLLNRPDISSTGELIYTLAKESGWPLNAESGVYVMSAILGDTQGLTNSLTSSRTYSIMSELTELGVNRPKLEEERREFSKMPPEILKYKARLIDRTELLLDGKLAIVSIPYHEITEFSPLYNPAPLIQNDMLQTTGVGIAVVLKYYNDGKILGAIRCNPGYAVAAKLAEQFGGGGHPYASGFKLTDGRNPDTVYKECISKTADLIATLEQDKPDETIQYAYTTD